MIWTILYLYSCSYTLPIYIKLFLLFYVLLRGWGYFWCWTLYHWLSGGTLGGTTNLRAPLWIPFSVGGKALLALAFDDPSSVSGLLTYIFLNNVLGLLSFSLRILLLWLMSEHISKIVVLILATRGKGFSSTSMVSFFSRNFKIPLLIMSCTIFLKV